MSRLPKYANDQERRSSIHHLAIMQGLASLRQSVAYIDAVWDYRPKPPENEALGVVVSQPALAHLLGLMLDSLASAMTLLFDNGKRRTESQIVSAIRIERVEYIRKICDGIDISALTNKSVRNKMVHYDEHLAQTFISSLGGFFAYLGISKRSLVTAGPGADPPIFIMCYVFDEDILMHLGSEIDVKAARDAAVEVIKRLETAMPTIAFPPG